MVVPSSAPVIQGAATAQDQAVRHRPTRIVLIGDSFAAAICHELPTATCNAFPGAFVSSSNGENFVAEFIESAHIQPGDLIVLSSVGGFHSPGVDDNEIVHRVGNAIATVRLDGARIVFLLSPKGGFPACGPNPSAEAMANFGHSDPTESCETMRRVREFVAASGERTIDILGPYLPDEIHQSAEAQDTTANAIRDEALR